MQGSLTGSPTSQWEQKMHEQISAIDVVFLVPCSCTPLVAHAPVDTPLHQQQLPVVGDGVHSSRAGGLLGKSEAVPRLVEFDTALLRLDRSARTYFCSMAMPE